MTSSDLTETYRAYLACLNRQDWDRLGDYVGEDVVHNGRRLGLAGYRAMLVGNFDDIPDLRFEARLVAAEPPRLAARLWFDCTPRRPFLGLDTRGRRVSFAEHAFYAFRDGKIVEVWSVIDKAGIEAQLPA